MTVGAERNKFCFGIDGARSLDQRERDQVMDRNQASEVRAIDFTEVEVARGTPGAAYAKTGVPRSAVALISVHGDS